MKDSLQAYDHSGVSECVRSIEPAAIKLLRNVHAPFVDFECLLHAILSGGIADGWSEGEVRLALRAVVVHLQPTDLAAPEDRRLSEQATEHVGFFHVRRS